MKRGIVESRIVRIGNSRGIRIPKPLLEQTGLDEDVEMVVQGNAILLRPPSRPRAGWGEAFRAMADRGDDRPADMGPPPGWDRDEWTW